jgi:hypothetical protein
MLRFCGLSILTWPGLSRPSIAVFGEQPRDTLRRPEIDVPDPINSLLDPYLGMHAVAQVTKERTDPPAPTYPVA